NASADSLTKNLQVSVDEKYKLIHTNEDSQLTEDEINGMYEKLKVQFDLVEGGLKRAPKFPMPSVWEYLASLTDFSDEENLNHLEFTLEKIADGGIYDHIGGGFARYSTDEFWHVPHFEKMLYDNGQLLSVYASAYKLTKNPKFKNVLSETANWLQREMQDPNGGFYSALDADSEGIEGKFYVWSYNEITELLENEDLRLICEYFDISEEGNWEGVNVLRVVTNKKQLIEKFQITEAAFDQKISHFKKLALETRSKRIPPGLDHKLIAGWNGLTLSGLCDAYQATQDTTILALARKNAHFISRHLINEGVLSRFPDKEMEGFLEDYAAVIQSFIKYYETEFNQEYLALAKQLVTRANTHFFDQDENLYFFSSGQSETLIARKKELFDNVIPSSNSMMAWNLVHLGKLLYRDELVNQGKSMLSTIKAVMQEEPEYMSNWGLLAMELSNDFAEIIIVGPKAESFASEINLYYLPNKIIAASQALSDSDPFSQKSLLNDETTIYVCYDKVCQRPVNKVSEALAQLNLIAD
ncbi:MAG: thioredoxin domain-containing protein, partial [Bacteroidota bacterium]